jgi:hypothetical protein
MHPIYGAPLKECRLMRQKFLTSNYMHVHNEFMESKYTCTFALKITPDFFIGCFLPSFSSFGQAILEEKIKM